MSAGSGRTVAVKSPPPAHVNRRVAVSVVESTLISATNPEEHHDAVVANVPSCWSCALCRPSNTSWKDGGAAKPASLIPTSAAAATARVIPIRMGT